MDDIQAAPEAIGSCQAATCMDLSAASAKTS
jgi:hypothetical protein